MALPPGAGDGFDVIAPGFGRSTSPGLLQVFADAVAAPELPVLAGVGTIGTFAAGFCGLHEACGV
jgi:hypothetical protein